MSIQEEKLAAIAAAIREKDGTTAPILANDFAARILAIPAGGGSDFAVPLMVYVNAGASISAVNGDTTITAISGEDGTATLILTAPGDWTVSAVLGGDENSTTVTVSEGYSIEITLGGRLPKGYKEVEYIESDNNCKITTPYKPNYSTGRIVLDVEPGNPGSTNDYLFCISDPLLSSGCNLIMYKSGNSYPWASKFGTKWTQYYSINISNKRTIIDCDFTKNTILFGDVSESFSKDGTQSNGAICLFAPSKTNISSIIAKLYSARMYDGDTLVYDFVPCIDPSGIVGLYDIVEGKFYKNERAGTFTAGSSV